MCRRKYSLLPHSVNLKVSCLIFYLLFRSIFTLFFFSSLTFFLGYWSQCFNILSLFHRFIFILSSWSTLSIRHAPLSLHSFVFIHFILGKRSLLFYFVLFYFLPLMLIIVNGLSRLYFPMSRLSFIFPR